MKLRVTPLSGLYSKILIPCFSRLRLRAATLSREGAAMASSFRGNRPPRGRAQPPGQDRTVSHQVSLEESRNRVSVTFASVSRIGIRV